MKGCQLCSNERLCIIPRGDNYEIAKMHLLNFNHFSRTTRPNFNQTWVKGIQICSNEVPFLRGDDYEITKIHWQNFENSQEPLGHGTKHP